MEDVDHEIKQPDWTIQIQVEKFCNSTVSKHNLGVEIIKIFQMYSLA